MGFQLKKTKTMNKLKMELVLKNSICLGALSLVTLDKTLVNIFKGGTLAIQEPNGSRGNLLLFIDGR